MASGLNKEYKHGSLVSIFPNPSEKEITIQFDQEFAKTITLFAIDGQKILEIHQKEISKNVIVDYLKSGMYTLQFTWIDGAVSYNKILVK